MKIAITGANGHVGNNLARQLQSEGHELLLMVNRNRQALKGLDAEIVQADLLDPEAVGRFVTGAEVVFHLAARIDIGADKRGQIRATNVQGTQNLLHACQKHGVRRLVHFSSIHAFDPYPLEEELNENRPLRRSASSAYDRSKIEGEELLLGSADGPEVVIVAPTSVYGPHDYYPSLLGKAMLDLMRGRIPMLIRGGYDFVYVADVVQGAVAAMDKGRAGEKYLLSGSYHSISELALEVGQVSGNSRSRPVLPPGFLRPFLPLFNLHGKLSGRPPSLTREALDILVESPRKVSSAKAEREFGYCKTPFKEGIQNTVEWLRETF